MCRLIVIFLFFAFVVFPSSASAQTTAQCYNSANVGTVGQAGWAGCAGMLIVDDATLRDATGTGDNSFAITSGGVTYTFADDGLNVFTGQVTDMSSLFYATSFNGDIGYWDTSRVTNMSAMFANTAAFNQDIGGWDTWSVTNMSWTFYYATAFNQDLSSWCVANLGEYSKRQNYDSGATSWSEPRPNFGATCSTGAASQLVVATAPVGGANGAVLGRQPIVDIRDAQGNVVRSDSTTQVTVSISGGTGGALGGTQTVTA